MPATIGIMDTYLEGLEECDRILVQHAFAPFRFTPGAMERKRIEESLLLTRDVFVDPITFTVFGKDEAELDHHAELIREHGDSIITGMANRQFNETFLPKDEDDCVLPTIIDLKDLHERYPVFGILIAAHDIDCEACETEYCEGGENEEDELLEGDKTPAQVIASLPDHDQRVLVALAQRFLDDVKPRFRPSQRLSLRTAPERELPDVLDEVDWLSALAHAFSRESFLWMVMNPYFCRETFLYAEGSDELLHVLWELEADLVLQLPFDIREVYEESASLFCGELTSEFFAKAKI